VSYYEVLLFLHIGAAAVWLGASVLFFLLFQRSKTAQDPVLAERLGAHTEWLAKRLFIPVSIAVLIFGILLTIEGRWGFDQLWILIGIAGMAATFALGVAVIEPTTKKMHATIEANGPRHPDVARYRRRLDALGVLDLALLFSIVWDMVFKPSGEDLGVLVIPAVAVAAAALNIVRVYRSAAETEAAPRAT
jgi:uncharacterized membrane protein